MKHAYVLMTASVGLLAACSSINEKDFEEKTYLDKGELVERVIFEVPIIRSLGDDDDTRASLSQEGDGGIHFGWESTDTVGIYPDQGAQVYFSMADGVGTNVASFDGGGWALRKGSTYSCYYPFVGDMYLNRDAIPVSFAGQEQNGVSSYNGIRFFLASEGTSSSSSGELRFSFEMLNTVIRIKASNLPAGTYTKLTLTTDSDVFVQNGTFGLDDMTIVGETYTNTLEVTLKDFTLTEPSTADSPVLIYLTSAPVDLTGTTVTVRAYSEYGIYKCEKEPSKAYEAGAWGGLKCDMVEEYSYPIAFADPEAKRICVENWDTNNDGELSYSEAAAVESLAAPGPMTKAPVGGSVFSGSPLKSFNELGFFKGLNHIMDNAFENCQSLMSVTFPRSIMSIGHSVFQGCGALASIIMEALTPPSVADDFYDTVEDVDIFVPQESVNAYMTQWPDVSSSILPGIAWANNKVYYQSLNENIINPLYSDSLSFNTFGANVVSNEYSNGWGVLTFDNDVTRLGHLAFAHCNMTAIVIPASVTSVEGNPIYTCVDLARIIVAPGNIMFDSRNNCNAIIHTETNTLVFGCPDTVIPNTVTAIGPRAFQDYYNTLTAITIPDSVTSIGDYAFYGCRNLPSVTIPNSVKSLGRGCFAHSGLTSITIPSSVNEIGYEAFAYCDALSALTIPSSVTTIGEGLVANCASIESLTVESGNPTYDSRYNCNAIIETASNTLIAGCLNTTIPTSVTKIGNSAFEGSCLSSISIPSSVTSIGDWAFAFSRLSSISIPSSVNYIGSSAFNGMSDLTSFTIPSSVSVIENNTFQNCRSLLNIDIPTTITCIRDDAFSDCESLQSIVFPSSVTEIGHRVLSNCRSLNSIYVMSPEPPMGNDMFEETNDCPIYVPSQSVDAYLNAYGWRKYANRIHGNNQSQAQSVIYYTSVDGLPIIPREGGFDAPILSNDYVNGEGMISFDGEVTRIAQRAFGETPNLSSIVIPSTVTSIDTAAFAECKYLDYLMVSPENPVFDSRENCNAVIKTASNTLVAGCNSTVIPYGVASIGDYAFYRLYGLTSIEIPESVTSIGAYAFYHCYQLDYVFIPETITWIGTAAFERCDGLTALKVSPENPVYDSRDYCNAIIETSSNTLITACNVTVIPESVTRIGDYAFFRLEGLTSISIPESVISVGIRAFSGCDRLMSITFLSPIPPDGGEEMLYNTNECPIFVPAASLDDYKSAMYWHSYADRIQANQKAVDLGLSVKWATCNLGASKPEEGGDFYAWGETEPYYFSLDPLIWKDGKEHGYWWTSYKWCDEVGHYNFTKYCPVDQPGFWDGTGSPDGKMVLEPEDDAAHVNLGGNWRMPTDAEWTELREKCTWTWTSQNGVYGRLVTARNGNSIFLPAAGYRYDTDLGAVGENGYYWSSSLIPDNPNGAHGVSFDPDDVSRYPGSRCNACTIRPVSSE